MLGTPINVAAAPADAETTASGLASKVLAKMAYGENPPTGYPAGVLVFDVKLIKIGR